MTKAFNPNSNNMRANALNQKFNILIHETKEDQERKNNKPSTFKIHPTHTSEIFPTVKSQDNKANHTNAFPC